MTNSLTVSIIGDPKSKGSLTAFGPGQMVEAVQGSKEWREDVADWARLAARRAGFRRIDRPAPIRVTADFQFVRRGRAPEPTTRSTYDVDKLARNLLDALQDADVIQDDSQVIDLHARKLWAPRPGLVVTVFDLSS